MVHAVVVIEAEVDLGTGLMVRVAPIIFNHQTTRSIQVLPTCDGTVQRQKLNALAIKRCE